MQPFVLPLFMIVVGGGGLGLVIREFGVRVCVHALGLLFALSGMLASLAASAALMACLVLAVFGVILVVSIAIFCLVCVTRDAPDWMADFYNLSGQYALNFITGVFGCFSRVLYAASTQYAIA